MRLNIQIIPRVSSKREIEELIEIDRWCYKVDPPQVSLDWIKYFPWAYTLVKRLTENGFKTMGYGAVLPVDNFIYEGLKRGELGENEITKEHIKMPDKADCLYFASFGTFPEITTYESSKLVGTVIGSTLRAQIPVVAVTLTKSGERVAREAGLKLKPYTNPAFKGINGYIPKYLEKEPFIY